MSDPEVIVRIDGAAGRLTLNRPRALNALTAGMCETMAEALLAWRDDDAVSLVLIDHAGERGFCAGGDIRMVAQSGQGDGVEARRFFNSEYRMNALMAGYPKPIVAVMDGITMGGGVGISMPAAIRIATERTLWAMPEGDIGLFPDVGGGWHLPRLPGESGTWLALTGARLKAADLCGLGIATHYAPSEKIETLKQALCDGPVEAALAAFAVNPGPSPLADHHEKLDRMFSADAIEQIMAALAEGGGWARAQAAVLERKCPTTLKVTLRLLREGAGRANFAEEMAVEYRLAVRLTRRHDFIEGVRAVIVDKDNAPRWSPATLAGVTGEMLDKLFSPLPAGEEWTPQG